MERRFSNRIAGWFAAAGVIALGFTIAGPLLTPPVSSAAVRSGASAPHPNANQFGELSAVWWQWIFSFPAGPPSARINPNLQNGSVDCGFGQSSHSRSSQIWFLAGTFGGTANRTCTDPIPHGIALFFPLFNTEQDNLCGSVPPCTFSIQQIKQLAAGIEGAPGLHASLNGNPIRFYGAQSEVFSYTFPATDNVYQYFGEDVPGTQWPGTTVFPAAADGYWAMIDPLPPGTYTLNFGGGNVCPTCFFVDVTYHFTVAP
jgi:hypothetical protein